jgi:hypothetical protein
MHQRLFGHLLYYANFSKTSFTQQEIVLHSCCVQVWRTVCNFQFICCHVQMYCGIMLIYSYKVKKKIKNFPQYITLQNFDKIYMWILFKNNDLASKLLRARDKLLPYYHSKSICRNRRSTFVFTVTMYCICIAFREETYLGIILK